MIKSFQKKVIFILVFALILQAGLFLKTQSTYSYFSTNTKIEKNNISLGSLELSLSPGEWENNTKNIEIKNSGSLDFQHKFDLELEGDSGCQNLDFTVEFDGVEKYNGKIGDFEINQTEPLSSGSQKDWTFTIDTGEYDNLNCEMEYSFKAWQDNLEWQEGFWEQKTHENHFVLETIKEGNQAINNDVAEEGDGDTILETPNLQQTPEPEENEPNEEDGDEESVEDDSSADIDDNTGNDDADEEEIENQMEDDEEDGKDVNDPADITDDSGDDDVDAEDGESEDEPEEIEEGQDDGEAMDEEPEETEEVEENQNTIGNLKQDDEETESEENEDSNEVDGDDDDTTTQN
jgi:hypothetical protein